MEIYALYGKSGTGKSHRAVKVAFNYSIPTIIDDGLIIHRGKKIPGSISAKSEKYKISAIKRAIFDDESYAAMMREKLKELDTDKILILGTSRGMIHKITKRLDLPEPSIWINVEELTSPKERKVAKNLRTNGKHVVPVAPTEVMEDIKVPLLGKLKVFLSGDENKYKKNRQRKKDKILKEQAIVRANYQSLGSIFINEKIIYDLVKYQLENDPRVSEVKEIKVHSPKTTPHVEAKISLPLQWGEALQTKGNELSKELTESLSTTTGMDELTVKIIISEVALKV